MSVTLTRKCRVRNCNRPANRVVISRCDFRNQWVNRGTSLCRTHERQESQASVTDVTSRTDWQNAHITHVRPEPVADKPRCGKCGRALRSAESIRRGMGRECARQVRTALTEAEYSASQVASAAELISDGAIVRISATVFKSVSSDGTAYYLTSVTGSCNCPCGIRSAGISKCYHVLSARILAGISAPVSRPAIAIGNPAPAYKATVCQYGDLNPVTHTVKNIRGVQGLCASHAAEYGYPQYLTPVTLVPRKAVPMTYPKVFANDVEEVRMNHRAAYLESKAAREEYKEAILAENVNPAMSRDYRTLSVQSDYEIAAHQAVRQAYSRLFSVVGADNL